MMTLLIGFRDLVTLLPAIQATGLLAFTLTGLSPVEHTSLSWTHNPVRNLLLGATHLMITCTDFGPLIQNQIYSGSTTYMVVIVPCQDLK